MCGAPTTAPPIRAGETIIEGTVTNYAGAPIPGAFVRLLDATGEFTAEVVTSATGTFRFFAGPGRWTIRALMPGATATKEIEATGGERNETTISLV